MKRAIAGIILIAASHAGSVYGQKTEFEVASVKPSPPTPGTGMRFYPVRGGPGTNDPGRAAFQNFSLLNLVKFAYGIGPAYQLSGPDWLDDVRFDIDAKIPDGATRKDFVVMMQNLLAERFKLSVHYQKKEMQTYVLVVAKNGPKLTPSPPDVAAPDTGPRPMPTLGSDGFPVLPPGPAMASMNGRARLQARKEAMERFTERLANQLGQPVTDATGLKGEYDYNLYWVTDLTGRGAGADVDSGPTLLTAIQDQLGLKLEATKGQIDVLVIDHVEKIPTEN